MTVARGMYLESCIDIEDRYKKPKLKKPSKEVLRNAKLINPIVYMRQTYKFKTSCMFDSIFELCSAANANYANYRATISAPCENEYCFASVVVTYSNDVNNKLFKEKRLILCLRFYECNDGVLVYRSSIGSFIKQLFEECYRHTFYIEVKKLFETEILNFSNLSDYIEDVIKKKKKTNLEPFLFVDVQQFCATSKTELKMIPKRI